MKEVGLAILNECLTSMFDKNKKKSFVDALLMQALLIR